MTSGHNAWISTGRLAELADISERCARKAVAGALAGKKWHGAALSVRFQRGQGGKAGTYYEIDIGSLPPALRAGASFSAQPELLSLSAQSDVFSAVSDRGI